MSTVAISICIPAYKKADQLAVLLESIRIQRFADFEVIVSDDTPDDSVKECCAHYQQWLPLSYHHNQPSLGSPANWNNAIRLARGAWIKLMHDDDSFTSPDSLGKLYDLTREGAGFVFSGFNIVESGRISTTWAIPEHWVNILGNDPRVLIVQNVIGHPSVTLHKNNRPLQYDDRMKWMVDIDFYIQRLQSDNFNFTREPLINIGHHEQQVTRAVFYDKNVAISENMLLLSKLGYDLLQKRIVYDYMWRLLRNYAILDIDELQHLSPVPVIGKMKRMLTFQRLFPSFLLKWGPASKILMTVSWILNRR